MWGIVLLWVSRSMPPLTGGAERMSQKRLQSMQKEQSQTHINYILVSENEKGIYGLFIANWNEMFFTDERVSDEEVLWVQEGSGTVWTMMGVLQRVGKMGKSKWLLFVALQSYISRTPCRKME